MQKRVREVSGNEEHITAKLLNMCVKDGDMCRGKSPEARYKGILSHLEFLEEKLH